MNIDKDIEIVKENIDDGTIYVRCGFTLNQAIENVLKEVERLQRENNTLTTQNAMMSERHFKDSGKLKELDTYKKVAEKLAEYIDKWGMCFGGECIGNCKQHIIEFAREEVESEK